MKEVSNKQLVFLSQPNLELARLVRQGLPERIVIYWKKGAIDENSAKILSESCSKVLADDLILAEVASNLGRDVLPLGHFTLEYLHGKNKVFNKKGTQRPIVLFPTSDTHAKLFISIARLLSRKYIFIIPRNIKEGARELLASYNLPYLINEIGLLEKIYPSIIVFFNDWFSEAISAIESARKLAIPSICIQEGCQDWDDEINKRMQVADFVFLQGALTTKYLNRDLYFLTGNPKYDSIECLSLPDIPIVMVNCNFTYGVYEEIRIQWIEDIVTACKELGLTFFISQHPRDKGIFDNFPVKPSNANIIHKQIQESSIVVSRFSTIIYEAIRMGRQVIYYNPHNEVMKTFEDDMTGGLLKAHSYDELLIALRHANSEIVDSIVSSKSFLALHCGSDDGLAALRCKQSIEEIVLFTEALRGNQYLLRYWLLIMDLLIEVFYIPINNYLQMQSRILKRRLNRLYHIINKILY